MRFYDEIRSFYISHAPLGHLSNKADEISRARENELLFLEKYTHFLLSLMDFVFY